MTEPEDPWPHRHVAHCQACGELGNTLQVSGGLVHIYLFSTRTLPAAMFPAINIVCYKAGHVGHNDSELAGVCFTGILYPHRRRKRPDQRDWSMGGEGSL